MRRRIFGLAPDEASFTKRGFRGAGEPAQARLERIGSTFIVGYMAALDDPEPESLLPAVEAVDTEVRGFAYEGAAMALALLDMLAPWDRSRVQRFLEGSDYRHVYMTYVGMGWAWARLGRSVEPKLMRVDPLLGWLAVDGYGFHEGFFHGARYVEQRRQQPLSGYAARVFDQGLGRSLWFVEGAGVGRIIDRVRSFPEARWPDLWAGVGLACTYAGGVDREALEELARATGPHLPQLRQGSVFAARARERAGNLAPHVELACDVLFGKPASVVAPLADQAERAVTGAQGDTPRFELWRQHIQRLTAAISGAA
ncbi:DUF1702 family protein [Pyxidicoccus sp. MSG2]|uniref:DUF1702 family protein n=1 Tax=Pyxidicoccus sp. MSG2 TaxID=2996790 RepID=UPI00226E64D6|nr:DUF1702 family protein [Pyxidicoccus sp. MSG2]MCY1021111.1 DUF1702 family protein [Pyxidicoccus sp. MSG2]